MNSADRACLDKDLMGKSLSVYLYLSICKLSIYLSICVFLTARFECPVNRSGVRTALFGCYMAGATCCNKQLPSWRVPCAPYKHMQISPHFLKSYIRRLNACLAVTSHLHFWQNDWDLLRATAVPWVERIPK